MASPYGTGGGLLPPPPSSGGMGLLGGGFNSPLTQMGLALLADNSNDPLRALGIGMRNAMLMRQMNQRERMANARWDLQQRQYQDKQMAAAEKARAAEAQREARRQALIASGMDPGQAETLVAAGVAEPYLRPPKPVQPPAIAQNAEWWANATPEQRAAATAYRQSGASRVDVRVGEGDKMLTPSEAGDLVHPETGEAAPYGMTRREAAAAGYRALTGADKAVRLRQAQQEDALNNLNEAKTAYDAAIEKAQQTRSSDDIRTAEEAAKLYGLRFQDYANMGRELSGEMQRALTPPGVLMRTFEQIRDAILGAGGAATPGSSSRAPPQTTRTIGGKTYVYRDGSWWEQ